MRSMKSVFGVIGALIPVLYCGYLLYYFLDVSRSTHDAGMDGIGPTPIGLAAFGVFFLLLFAVKMVRTFGRPRAPRSDGNDGARGPGPDGESRFDADAVVARYMAQRQPEAASGSSAAPPPARGGGGGPTRRSGFGRKNA